MASWGAAKKSLPVGRHLAQVRDYAETESKPMNPGEEPKPQFKWGVDVQYSGKWNPWTIWTGQNFCDPSQVKDPQFITKLTKFAHACGVALPKSEAEALAWDPNCMIGQRFFIEVVKDDLTGKVTETYKRVPAPQVAPAPTATAPSPASDPFDGDAGAHASREPVGAAASTPDPW